MLETRVRSTSNYGALASNNVWTGTNYISTADTAAFKVGTTPTLLVNTTNNQIVFGGTGAGSGTVEIDGNVADLYCLYILRTTTSRPTGSSPAELSLIPTWNWSGNTLLNQRTVAVLANDNRTVSGGTVDQMVGLDFQLTRNISFTGSGGLTSIGSLLYANRSVITDNGSYTSTTGNQGLSLAGNAVTTTANPTINKSGKTMSYDTYGNRTIFVLTPTITAGTMNHNVWGQRITMVAPVVTNSGTYNLIYKGIGDEVVGTATGTTMGVSFYSSLSTFDTTWFAFNDTINNSYSGGDASKTYWGTGGNTLGSFSSLVGDCYIDFTSAEMEIVSDNNTSTDSMLLRAGTNGLKFNIGATQQAIITANLLTTISGFNIDSGGIFTKYNNISTVSGGVPAEYATSDLTNQSAAIVATTIYAVPASGAGVYRVSWVATVTTAATTSCVLGGTNGFQLKYTDADDSVVKTENPTTVTSSAVNATGTSISGVEVAYCKASTNLQYLFDYTSVGVTAMVYNLHIKVEKL